MTYDVHAHCIPAGVVAALEREGGRYGIEIRARDGTRVARVAGGSALGPVREDLVDVPARLETMDRTGVDVQLLSGWIGLTGYTLSPEAGARYARMFNEALAETVSEHPERFLGLCYVPLQAPERAAGELRRAVEQLGMVGTEIATTVDGSDLDDESLEPFWAAAADLRCLVLIHPDQTLPGRRNPRHFLNNTVGNAAETTIAVGHLICGGVLERYPDLRICLVHGGGYLPYQAGRLDHGYDAVPGLVGRHLTRPPSDYLRRLFFDTVTHSPAVLRFLVDFAGADHVVLGSDYPFEMGDPDPVRTVRGLPGLSEDQRQAILDGNVRRLLGDVRSPTAHG
ncbi:MAG: amidohydrolase family protein [Egibacteraceae bacterium]